MDSSEKIINFNSLDELFHAIMEDAKSTDFLSQRYGVRFIMLNNFDTYRSVVKFLTTELDVKNLDLENFLFSDDKWMTIDSLREIITSCKCSTIITPFSELARFYDENDFRGFFNDIILNEDLKDPDKRIYIPLIGLQNRFTDFLKSFGRISESAPIWQLNTNPNKVTVYLSKYSDFELPNTLGLVQISTMKDWLRFWKTQAPQSKVICSSKPIRVRYKYSKPDSIFSFYEISNSYQFITDFLSLDVPIEYHNMELPYWDRLMESIDKKKAQSFDFKKFVCCRFNRISISLCDLFELWTDPTFDDFDRWLLKYYISLVEIPEESEYLNLCLSETDPADDVNTLYIKIAERIFYMMDPIKQNIYLDERRDIMRRHSVSFKETVPASSQSWIREQILQKFEATKDPRFVQRFCTRTFDFEKQILMSWYVLYHAENFGRERLFDSYPELYFYLEDITTLHSPQNKWCVDYFREYKCAKLSDSYTAAISSFIKQYNNSDESFYNWYYSFNNCHELLNEFLQSSVKPDLVYWIDGLGAEFLPFILKVIEESKTSFSVAHAEVARTNIPSNTHLNSYPVNGKDCLKFGELDECAHKEHYKKYLTLIEELDIVQTIINKILSDNISGLHTIAIVSDHGLSSLSRMVPSTKLSKNVQHEGRYVRIEHKEPSEEEFVTHLNEADSNYYRVALTHASLGTKPSHEVHGGCTPEEVLVPFIVITNDDANKLIDYKIELKSTSIPISDATLEMVIMPEPKSVILSFDGQDYTLVKSGTLWKTTILSPKQGKFKATITPHRGLPQTIEFEFYGVGFSDIFEDFDM